MNPTNKMYQWRPPYPGESATLAIQDAKYLIKSTHRLFIQTPCDIYRPY